MSILPRLVLGLAGLLTAWWLVADRPLALAKGEKTGTSRNPSPVAAEIDRLIDAKLAEAKLPASPLADDAEFLRRACLDITGRIPSYERTVAFLKDDDQNKRAKLIDELLSDAEYGEHFGTVWYHRIVKPDDDNRLLISHDLQDWLAEQFNKNQPWNKIVNDILTATGERDKHPETIFWLANVGDNKARNPEPNKVTGAATKLFLGIKLECCECHNHPFTSLKQTDFWGVAAFFGNTHSDHASKKDAKAGTTPGIHEGGAAAKVGKKDAPMEKAPVGSIVIPDTKGKTVKAKFLGAEEPPLAGKTALRPIFAAWATSAKNPYFSRAQVNKMWANFFGHGFIDPVDDMRPEAKNSHPELLKYLSEEFTASGFDLKHMIRCICLSKTYQRSSQPLPGNKDDDKLYSHAPVKVMTADMLYDSLATALGHAAANTEKTKGMGKKKGPGGPREQFRKFFHAEADDDVGVAEDYTHGIPQALRLMNSRQVNDSADTINRLVKSGGEPEKIIEGLYLTVLTRKPTDLETQRMKKYVAESKDSAKGYADLMWVLLNSGEFLFNH